MRQGFSDPTEAQLHTILKYSKDDRVPGPIRFGIATYIKERRITFDHASKIIDMIKPWLENGASTTKVSEEGIYVNRDAKTFFLVQKARSSGRLYAKKLIVVYNGIRNSDGSWHTEPRFDWEYDKGAIYQINADWRITKEEAKAFGDYWHHCIKCHTRLTRQSSIDQGMGDTCAGKI